MKPFLRNTLFLVLITLVVGGCDANGRFKLHSKLTGTLGVASAVSKETGNRYTIRIDIATQGVYNLLRGKRTERYTSRGHIRKGVYYSDFFTIERWQPRNHFHDLATYQFQYKTHKIIKHYQTWNGKKLLRQSKNSLEHFGHDDYLTVMRNAAYLARKTSGKRTTYIVAGSEETHNKVPIYLSTDPNRIQRWGGAKGGYLIQMGIHKGIFKKGSGSMTVLLDGRKNPTRFIFSNLKTLGTLTGVPTR